MTWPNPRDEDLELEALFADGAPVEDGILLPMPSMPLPRPVDEGDVSTGELISRGQVPQQETLEQPSPALPVLRRGDEITLPDGTKTKLQWVSPDRRRVGVGSRKGRNYTFYSMEEFVELSGREVAEDWKKKRDKAARDEGMPTPKETPKLPRKMYIPKGFTLYPHQLENIEFLEQRERGLIADEMGLGKAQPLDACILTPSGWVRMGDVQVGDLVVDPDTGRSASVTGVFDRGERDCYRVTMSDGNSTECCDDHLWTVQTPTDKHRNNRWRTMPLSQFMNDLHQQTTRGDQRRKWFVPLTHPVEGESLDLPVDPYLLGVLLGDGTMPAIQSNGTLGTPYLSTGDAEIVRMAQSAIPSGLSLKQSDDNSYDYRISRDSMKTPSNALSHALMDLGLASCSSHEKFVPSLYLRAAAEDRLSLLQGLCDTDGSWTDSAVEFSTTSPFLRDAVVELTYSLGGFCSVYEKAEPSYTYRDEKRTGRPAWRVYLRMSSNPFRLQRKASLWRPTHLARGFEAVEYVGKKQMRCIAVDSRRNLYVTDGYIVTHNTITAIVPIRPPAVVVCPSLLKVNWARELHRWHPKLSVAIINGTKAERGAEYFDPAEDVRMRKAAASGKRPRRRSTPPSPSEVARIQQKADVVVINYDILASHAEWIMRRNNATLVADEAHYLKNIDIRWDKKSRRHVVRKGTQRGKVFYAMQREITRLYLLTGTPILNRVIELFPLLHMIDSREWGSGWRFCHRYCAPDYVWVEKLNKEVMKCDGRSHSDELHERIKGVYMMRHTKEQELAEFPEKTVRTQLVSMPKRWRDEYRRASRAFMEWVEESGGPEAVARAQMAQQLVQLGKLRAIAAQGKVEAGLQWIVRFFESTQRPLVVFALHEAVFDALEKGIDAVNEKVRRAKAANRLPPIDREIRVGRVTGGISGQKRQQTIDAFQQEGSIDVLLYSIPIATGTTLTRASDALFLERMWRPADLNQAEDRMHRIGQENTVFINYLDAEGTIDAKLGQLLVRKSEAFSAVIDGVELETDEAAAMVFGEMFREMGFDISRAQMEAIAQAAGEESAELMKNPNNEDTLKDPYVQAALSGTRFEQYVGGRSVTPNPSAAGIFDDDDEFVDSFGDEYYEEETDGVDEAAASDSWFDPL